MDLQDLVTLSSAELAAQRETLTAELLKDDPTALAGIVLDTADKLARKREQADADEATKAEQQRLKLVQIENMSHAQLKASAADLIAAAEKEPVADLASRYIQARTDAKQRDERLAEMGAELTAQYSRIADLTAERDAQREANNDLSTQLVNAEEIIADKDKALATANKSLAKARTDKQEQPVAVEGEQ